MVLSMISEGMRSLLMLACKSFDLHNLPNRNLACFVAQPNVLRNIWDYFLGPCWRDAAHQLQINCVQNAHPPVSGDYLSDGDQSIELESTVKELAAPPDITADSRQCFNNE